MEGMAGSRARVGGVGMVNPDIGVDTTSFADYRELIDCTTVGSEVEGRKDTLGELGGIFVLA